jgi:MoaA/NifB/PqqE/SkfB family radical SAM enzyme/SAM-dependent methyltransferase
MDASMKALIKVGYGCNDHCSFCHTLDVRHIDAEAVEVHRKIDRAKALGHTMIVLSGGEPTIRPELVEWASHAARLDMDFGLVTNGRMLSYPALVDALMERRLRYVYLSLHGGTAKVHDLMVRSEAFEQSYGAVGVLSGRGLDLTVNCVITRHNVDHLRGLVDAMLPYRDAVLKFSMVEPKGGGAALFEHLMPRIAHVADRVKDAIAYGRERAPDARFEHGAIPLCLMRGFEEHYSDLKTHRFRTMIEVGEPDFFPVDDANKIQPKESCAGCSLSGACPGLYRGYHEIFGAGELAKVADRTRSNSFHYVFESLVRHEARCPLLEDGTTPHDRGRDLFVKHGERIARYRAETRDFSDVEIEAIKLERGQLYVDLSKKDAPDDFARDLRPLARSAMCQGCTEHDRCTGMFEPNLDEDPFSRDDARVRAILRELEGDVLDVGAGDARFATELGASIESGRVRYSAFDPDARAIERIRARWPEAEVWVASAEVWAAEVARTFDHVLVLRSWNHLVDPARVCASIARALRPQGTLTVIDDAPFALVRNRSHAARAERSSAGLEHYRNDTAADASRVLDASGLTRIEMREVSPETSSLWLLRYARS